VQSVLQCKRYRRLPFLYNTVYEKHSTCSGIGDSTGEIAGAHASSQK